MLKYTEIDLSLKNAGKKSLIFHLLELCCTFMQVVNQYFTILASIRNFLFIVLATFWLFRGCALLLFSEHLHTVEDVQWNKYLWDSSLRGSCSCLDFTFALVILNLQRSWLLMGMNQRPEIPNSEQLNWFITDWVFQVQMIHSRSHSPGPSLLE